MKKLLTLLLCTTASLSFAQVCLAPLTRNNVLVERYPELATLRILADTLDLPFFDDFSAPGVYPSPDRWTNQKVYINNDMPVNPVSIGVATFDGINEKGTPYNPGSAQQGACDTLTSFPLNLNLPASDSVYLSFFYQPQGRGRAPGSADSLVLQFKKQNGQWVSVWKVTGTPMKPFKQVIIPITNSVFLVYGFQFRFINYGSLSGNQDHWHVDYIKLDKGRSFNEPINDVAITAYPSETLNEYRAMPWQQYRESFRKSNHFLPIRNNFPDQKNVNFNFSTTFKQTGVPQDATAGGLNVKGKADSSIIFYHNTTLSEQNQPFTLQTRYSINVSGDVVKSNDTLIYEQPFKDYYAYDDGTAEQAFFVNAGVGAAAKAAIKFTLSEPDTITSVRIFFNRVSKNVANELFSLMIWKELDPETIIYQKISQKPLYVNTINGFAQYTIDSMIVLDGSFYVGWSQIGEKDLQLGFDVNTDHQDRIFVKTSSEPWINSPVPGSLMVRPVFADQSTVMGIEANSGELLNVYPNPVNDRLYLEGLPDQSFDLMLINQLGQVLRTEHTSARSIPVDDLTPGLYVLRVSDSKGKHRFARFIKH